MTEHVIFPSFCNHPFLFRGWHLYCYPLVGGIAQRPNGVQAGWAKGSILGIFQEIRKAAAVYGHDLPDPGFECRGTADYRFRLAFVDHFGLEGIRVLCRDWRGDYEVPSHFAQEHPRRLPLLADFGHGIERPFRPPEPWEMLA